MSINSQNITDIKSNATIHYLQLTGLKYNHMILKTIRDSLFSFKRLQYEVNKVIAKELDIHIIEVGYFKYHDIEFNLNSEFEPLDLNYISENNRKIIEEKVIKYINLIQNKELEERFFTLLQELLIDLDFNQIRQKLIEIDNYRHYNIMGFECLIYYYLYPLWFTHKILLNDFFFRNELLNNFKEIEIVTSPFISNIKKHDLTLLLTDIGNSKNILSTFEWVMIKNKEFAQINNDELIDLKSFVEQHEQNIKDILRIQELILM